MQMDPSQVVYWYAFVCVLVDGIVSDICLASFRLFCARSLLRTELPCWTDHLLCSLLMDSFSAGTEVTAEFVLLGPVIEGDFVSAEETRASLSSADLVSWKSLRSQLHKSVLEWLLTHEPYQTLTGAAFVKSVLEILGNYADAGNDVKHANPGKPKEVLAQLLMCLPEAQREGRVNAVNLALAEASVGFEQCPLVNVMFHRRTKGGKERVDFANKAATFYYNCSEADVRSMLERQDDNDVFCCLVCGLIHKEGEHGRFQVPHLLWHPVCSWCHESLGQKGDRQKPPQVLHLVQIRSTSDKAFLILFSEGMGFSVMRSLFYSFFGTLTQDYFVYSLIFPQ